MKMAAVEMLCLISHRLGTVNKGAESITMDVFFPLCDGSFTI